MKLKYGLLTSALSDAIYETIRTYITYDALDELDIDLNEIVNRAAIKALFEIQNVIRNDAMSDYDAIEEIVKIFEKYDISVTSRHNS